MPDEGPCICNRSRAFEKRLTVRAVFASVAALIPVWAAIVDADPRALGANCLLGWALLWLAWIDLRTMRLPDAITLPLLLCGLLATWLLDPDDLLSGVIGAAAGFATFRMIAWAYATLRGREGLGQGDAKLLAVGGAWLGWEALPWIVLAASVIGLGVVAMRYVRGAELDARTMIPFGPAIALAIWIIRLHDFPTP